MNKKGFSLIEILVAIGIVGVMSVFLARIFQGSLQNSKLNRSHFEEAELLNRIYSEFSKKAVCVQNLFPAGVPTPMDRSDISQLLDSDGTPFLEKGKTYGQSGALQVTNISTSKISDSSLKLSVMLERNFKNTGPRSYERSLRFFVESDGTNITGCFEIEDSVKNTITQITCLANADRGVYTVITNPLTGEVIRCERIGFDLTPCALGDYVDELKAPIAFGLPYTQGCIPFASNPSHDCSSQLGALVVFDTNGVGTCANPTKEQAIQAFDTRQGNPKNCTSQYLLGFKELGSKKLEVDCI